MTHHRTAFAFSVDAPVNIVAPLFGAWEERRWAPDWTPRFVHPAPAADIEGAVFLVDEPPMIWVNTRFDLAAGVMQYVNVSPNSFVTRIDIHLRGENPERTRVDVVYERTALAPAAADLVDALAATDRHKGDEWAAEIGACLARTRA